MLSWQEEPAPGEEHSWQGNSIGEGSEAREGLRASVGAEGGGQLVCVGRREGCCPPQTSRSTLLGLRVLLCGWGW